jgi:putative heme iron utilization protein
MSEINGKKKDEKNELDIKKIILISIISSGIIIILYYLFSKEEGDDRARIWNILEKCGQVIGIIEPKQTIKVYEYNSLGEEEPQPDGWYNIGGRKNIMKYKKSEK